MNIIKSYDFWRQKEAGKNPPFSDGDVHLGYWRYCTKRHDNGGDPVSITVEDGEVLVRIWSRLVADFDNVFDAKRKPDETDKEFRERTTNLAELFTRLIDNPISYQAYSDCMDAGHWPGFKPVAPKIGDNNPPPEGSYEWYRDQIDGLSAQINALIKNGAAKTKKQADEAAATADRLCKLYGRADKAREAEKAPHWQKCVEIQRKWTPLLSTAEIYKKVKEAVILPWQSAEKKRLAEETRQAEAEAEKKRLAAEEAQRKADEEAQRLIDHVAQGAASEDQPERSDLLQDTAAEADRLKREADEAARKVHDLAKATPKVGGFGGRSIGLRTITEVKLADRKLAATALKNEPLFLEALDVLLEEHGRRVFNQQSGRRLDGFTYPEKEIAA